MNPPSMGLNPKDIAEKIKALAEPLAVSMGFEIVQVECPSGKRRSALRIFIDKPGGITVDDCADFSREFGLILDVNEMMEGSYDLEVSSPGLDRALSTIKDFIKFKGRKVRLRTKEPIEGNRRNIKAVIEGAEGRDITVRDFDGVPFTIALSNIDSARLIAEL